MNYLQKLWRVELLGLASLVIVAAMIGTYFSYDTYPGYYDGETLFWAFFVGFSGTLFLGILPVVAYGTPLYTLQLNRKAFTKPMLYFASILPGLVIMLVDFDPGSFWAVGGVLVAIILGRLARFWPGLH